MKLHLPLALRFAIFVAFSSVAANVHALTLSGYEGGIPYENNKIEWSGHAVLTFASNSSEHDGGCYSISHNEVQGGKLRFSDNGSLIFRGNTANAGGALRSWWMTSEIDNNRRVAFKNNIATGTVSSDESSDTPGGGAINGAFSIHDNETLIFEGNKALYSSGGAIASRGEWLFLSNNSTSVTFTHNEAGLDGGAIGLKPAWGMINAGYSHYSAINGNNNVSFTHNAASRHGGAICVGWIQFSGNKGDLLFSDNKAGGYGGAIYASGTGTFNSKWGNCGVWLFANENVYFSDNIAESGSAIYSNGVVIADNKEVIFKNNEGGAIISSGSEDVIIHGNDLVIFQDNDMAFHSADDAGLVTNENPDSAIYFYDPIQVDKGCWMNSGSARYDSNHESASKLPCGTIYFRGKNNSSVINGNCSLNAGSLVVDKGASLKIKGAFQHNAGNVVVEQSLSGNPTLDVSGSYLKYYAEGDRTLSINLKDGVANSETPIVKVGGEMVIYPQFLKVDDSDLTSLRGARIALLSIGDHILYSDDESVRSTHYYFDDGQWRSGADTLAVEDVLSSSISLQDGYSVYWEDKTLFYSYLIEPTVTYTAKGYESDNTWWGKDKLSWYDVDKQKVLNSDSTGSSAGINQDGDLSCWIAVACNMIQYWQDKYAPLYPGSGLITPTKRESYYSYRDLYDYLYNTNNVSGVTGRGTCMDMLSLWFANPITPTPTINFKADKGTAWRELGFTDRSVVELFNYEKFRDDAFNNTDSLSEKNEKLKKKVQEVFTAWSDKAYSPIALSIGDGTANGHEVTVWKVEITGDVLTLTYTDSDFVKNNSSTMKAMFVDGEFIITEYQTNNKKSIKADGNSHMMPQTLGGTKQDTKWTIKWLAYISTPDGVDEMLKDYYKDNEYYWTGKRDTSGKRNTLELDTDAPKNRLADESSGWMKKCDSASLNKSVWVNAYLKDSKSKLIFSDNIHGNNIVSNKQINLPESLKISAIDVPGKDYILCNTKSQSVKLESDNVSVSGLLNMGGKLELSSKSLNISGKLLLGNVEGLTNDVKIKAEEITVSGILNMGGKSELSSKSLNISGSLLLGNFENLTNDVKIKADCINVTGLLDLYGVSNGATVALDGCEKITPGGTTGITLDGTGELKCIKLKLQESKDDNKNLTISITPDIKMKNCIVTSTSGTISYIVSSSSQIVLNPTYREQWETHVLTFLTSKEYGNNTIDKNCNYKYKFYIDKTNASVNDSTAKGMNLGLSGGSTLEVLQDGLSPETLSFGSTGVFNASSTADIAISESAGATLLAGASPLLTLPGEEVYLPDATVIEAPELTVSEDSTLENHGSLADVDSLVVEYDGVLSGNGVFGGTTVYEGGRVMVGGSPGAPVYDSLSMLSGSDLVFCLDGSKPASAAENGWGSGTHSLLTVTQADGLTLESGTAVLVGCSLDFLNSVTVGDTQTLTLVQLGSAADAALLAALQSGTEFKLANADDSLEELSSVGALVHSTSWEQGGNNTLTLSFIVSSCPENALVWTDASGNGTWDSASQNWAQQDGTGALFSADRNVLITRGGSINLAEMLSVGDVVVSSRDNLVLAGSGSLGGDGSLVKEGRGELSITTANTYSGGTYVNGGKLKVLHAEALGLGGVLLQGGELEIGVNGVDNALVNNAVSRLTIAPGVSYALPIEIYNSGELTISGTLNADALTDAADFAATRLDAAGNEGAHGFVRDAGSKVVVVSGAGTLDAAAATVTRDGKDYVLGSDGIAVHGMEVHGGSYLAGSGHSVKLSEVVTAAATHGASATDVLLSGGSLTADRALTGTLSASGTSSLVAENWMVSSSFTNAGMLSISGSIVADGMTTESIAATRVDVNGNTGAHGFVKNAGSRFTLVDLQNGGSLDIGALSITRNGTDYLLGNDGVALAEGSVECSAYLIGPGHEVKLSRVVTAAATHGASATDVLLSGGSLTADRALTGTLTAIGTSSLVAENWAVNNSFTNEGNLSIRGSIVADGINCESISATHVDVNGNTGEHGFAKDAGSKFTLVQLQHGGSLDIGPLSISRDGTDYTLQADGTAHAGEATHYGRYTIGSGHEARLSQVAEAAGNHGEDSTHIDLAGGTLIADRALTGQLKCIGNSTLKAENWAVSGSFTNEGTLSISGSIVADGMTAESIAATHVDVDGNTGADGFSRDAGSRFTLVQLQNGGSLDIGSLSITRDGTEYTLHADGTAHAGETTHYGRYTIGTGHEVRLSQVAAAAGNHGEASTHIDLAGGTLIADRALTGQLKCIGNSTLKAENWAVSGSFTNEGTLSISGSIVADGMTAESIAVTHVDVDGNTGANGFSRDAGSRFTLVQLQNGGSLEVGELTLSRQGMNYTLGADGAAVAEGRVHYNHYLAGNGHRAAVSDIVRVAAWHGVNCTDIHLQGGTLAADAPITGALTLGGGSIELDGRLTVQGDVTFESGTQTTLDISGWTGADDGEVLVDFGSSCRGYTEGCLKLSGIAGFWNLEFDPVTGTLTLAAVRDASLLNLNRNQTAVYNTIRNYGTPAGLLGELAKEMMASRDEAQIKQMLDEMGGAEYATLMSGQQAAASGHMRRLRGEMGSGHLLAGTKTRAYIEAYNHRSELDADASGRGYELNESGGQFALEFIGEGHTSGGFAVAAGRSKLQPDGGMTQKSDNTYVDAFVLHRDGAYMGKFSLGVGVHKYDLDRRVAGNAVSADTSGSSVNFMHESAYSMVLDENNSVQVFGAVESSFNKLGAFHEKGADTASLQVESQDAWVTTLSVGARYLYSFDAVNSAPAATLSLQGGLEFDFGDTESEVEMNFAGSRSLSFRQSGAERDTFGYNLGASLHLPVSTKAAIYASGEAVLRGNSYEVNANVGLQMAF